MQLGKAIALAQDVSRSRAPTQSPQSSQAAGDPNDTASRSRQVAVERTYSGGIRTLSETRYRELLADAQLLDDGLVTLGVVLLQIVQQATSLANHHEKTAAGRMVLLVRAEMIGQLSNTFAQNCNLNFGAARVIRVGGVLRNDVGLLLSC